MSQPCAICPASAVISMRIKPRRDLETEDPGLRRALSWPGGIAPAVGACADASHQRQVERMGHVLGITPLSDTVVSIVLKDGAS